jgi:hypothetical protein
MVKTILVMWGLKFRSCCRVLKCSIKRTWVLIWQSVLGLLYITK